MNQYFTKVTADHWIAKNKNQEVAQKIARRLENLLIEEKDLNDFIEHFQNEIKLVTENNKRCTPLKLCIMDGESFGAERWWLAFVADLKI